MLTAVTDMMKASGANVVVTPCPFCFVQFDQKQSKNTKLPVLYITELYALAFDILKDKDDLKYHRIKVDIHGD
jgi:heterodisulfide reductase subunit B